MENRNKIIIENLLLGTGRKGMEDLLHWMDQNGFYDAPCSSRYHLSVAGGLALHSKNVYDAALEIATALVAKEGKPLSFDLVDSICICTLLHDLGKTGQFGKQTYIKNEDTENGGAFKGNKDLLYIPHEIRSIAIASQFIELTEEEQFAIIYHNGLYGELKGVKGHETELYMILHFADMWASRVIEREE